MADEQNDNGEIPPEQNFQALAAPSRNRPERGVVFPPVDALNFELKPIMFNMIRDAGVFNGLPTEDPYNHLNNFLNICENFRTDGVTEESMRMRLFPHSLTGKAKTWFKSLTPGSIHSWEELATKFIERFLPMSRVADVRAEISNFRMFYGENLYEAWERYKDLIRKCPNHGVEKWGILQTFYKGIDHTSQSHLDFAAGGYFFTGTLESRYEIIEKTAERCLQWPLERMAPTRKPGMLELDKQTCIEAQLATLMNEVKGLKGEKNQPRASVSQVSTPEEDEDACPTCGNKHEETDCPLTRPVYYADRYGGRGYGQGRNDSQNQGGTIQKDQNHNPQWRPPSNARFSNSSNHPPNNNSGNYGSFDRNRGSNPNSSPGGDHRISSLEDYVKEYVTRNDAVVRNIESHLGQIASTLKTRIAGTLPGDTEVPTSSTQEQA